MEMVDILQPPLFVKSGKVKSLVTAWEDGEWIGTFNLWIVQSEPVPAVVYQMRSPKSSWAPSKLDVTAGGHYEAGEKIADGLREVEEELGRKYKFSQLFNLGRKLHVGFDVKNRKRLNVVDIFMVIDNTALSEYLLQEEEVFAICACPIDKLIKAHGGGGYKFNVEGWDAKGKKIEIQVSKDKFPENWDPYHFKIVLLAKRFLDGEKVLIY